MIDLRQAVRQCSDRLSLERRDRLAVDHDGVFRPQHRFVLQAIVQRQQARTACSRLVTSANSDPLRSTSASTALIRQSIPLMRDRSR
jgi:hypothetical protein